MSVSLKTKFSIQTALVCIVFAAVAVASWFIFDYVVQAKERVEAAQAELAQLDAEQRQISDMSREYDEVEPLVPELEQVLLKREDKLAFIMLVERLAKEASVLHVIEAVADEPATAAGRAKESVVFNINVFGGFSNTLKFMYFLENGPYYLALEKMHITQGGSGLLPGAKSGVLPGKDDVKVQLSVLVFTQPQKK